MDIEAAKKILSERGVHISEQIIQIWREKRIEKLRVQKEGQIFMIIVGFAFSFTGLYVSQGLGLVGALFWMFGLAIGMNYALYKRKLPSGEMIHNYTKGTRRTGIVIISFNVLCVIAGIMISFLM